MLADGGQVGGVLVLADPLLVVQVQDGDAQQDDDAALA